MTDQRTTSLVILGIIAVIAIIGLVLMFKSMPATGDIVQVGRAIATKGKAIYEPPRAWGGMATGIPAVQEGHVFGQSCALLTTQHVAEGLIDLADYNEPERGCCAPYLSVQSASGASQNCCLTSCLRAQVNLIPK